MRQPRRAAWMVFGVGAVLAVVPRPAVADCAADAASLATYLRTLSPAGVAVAAPPNLSLATRDDLGTGYYALVVSLGPNTTAIGGKPIALADLQAELAARATEQSDPEWQRLHAGMAGHYRDLAVAVDASRPWSDVVALATTAAKSGFQHLSFSFAKATQPKPPPHTSVDDAIASDRSGSRIVALSPVFAAMRKKCPALGQAMGPPSHEPDYWTKTFVPAIQTALTTCGCTVDAAELRSAIFYEVTPPVSVGTIEITLGTGPKLALDGKTRWSTGQKSVKPGAWRFAVK